MPGYAIRTDPQRAVEAPLWAALIAAPTPTSVAELHVLTRAKPNAIQHRLARWRAAGLVIQIQGRPNRFIMSDTIDPKTPMPAVTIAGRARFKPRTARARMWSAIRVLRSFDLPQLLMSAACSRRSGEDFINCLVRAGYLRTTSIGNPTRGTWTTYCLARNSGPVAPIVRHRARTDGPGRIRLVVDGNTGAEFDISPGTIDVIAARPSARSRSVKSASPATHDGGVS